MLKTVKLDFFFQKIILRIGNINNITITKLNDLDDMIIFLYEKNIYIGFFFSILTFGRF